MSPAAIGAGVQNGQQHLWRQCSKPWSSEVVHAIIMGYKYWEIVQVCCSDSPMGKGA
ncbi:hypothetical protein PHLCEN_2v1077 [Hermanssonia centrifuga]|uniref:Uncharacterized protein n=1 Tax=Hermanssonia centrifuga TaxID=98765 RepID=A0A2R6S430_9APHY|nr:hypothetical protein PHLCEN_2v1077 [Hermanssonia centrifuga]